jgi:hypothetical protein
MKKLMLTAAAAAMATGAFAAPQGDPVVYDYKASVRHMYLREVPITVNKTSYTVYQKFQKNASLKGYLIMDSDGATSQAIVKRNVLGYKLAQGVDQVTYNLNLNPATGVDFGRNRGFLVVLNTSLNGGQEKQVKYAKVLPAVLDAKWIDDQFTKGHTAKKGPAEGTLYVGGDMVAATRYNLDKIDYLDATAASKKIANGIFERGNKLGGQDDTYARIDENTQNPQDFYGVLPALPVAANSTYTEGEGWQAQQQPNAGIAAIADYRWTSLHLFGWFNGPNWFDNGQQGPFDNFETVWDKNLPPVLQVGFAYYHPYFHDTWMNGAGFGFWTKDSAKTEPKRCCGRVKKGKTTYTEPLLESLQGALKGGLFICTENGIDAEDQDYSWFDKWAGGRGGWEDQFVTARLAPLAADNTVFGYIGSYITRGDRWQNDMWQDGSLQQETTDVISGTWAIKLNTKFLAENGPYDKLNKQFAKDDRGIVTWDDINNLVSYNGNQIDDYVETAYGLEVLVGTIKAAVLTLSPKAVFINGKEISDLEYDYQDTPALIPSNVPAITPAFALYYGLANWKIEVQP